MTIAKISGFIKDIERTKEFILGRCEFNEIKETFVRNWKDLWKMNFAQMYYTAIGSLDGGGNSMNLFRKALLKINCIGKRKKRIYEADLNEYDYEYDYGIAAYKSIEFGFKPSESNDFGYKEHLLHRMIRLM